MQLKSETTKKTSLQTIKNILVQENDFINNLFDILPIPVSSLRQDFDEDDFLISKSKKNVTKVSNGAPRAKTLNDLQSRLEEFKNKRGLNYKQKLVKKGLKNRIKKKEKKNERKLQKKMKQIVKTEQQASEKPDNEDTKPSTSAKPVKPIFNNQGKMVFSKFDFSATKAKSKKIENDPRKQLENIQKQKDKIRQLKESGETEKAIELKEKVAWKNALAKADGQKVKDDPELLKKTLQKREQRIKKSKKKWEERDQHVQKTKEERQRKRSENLQKRKKEKKMKKIKTAVKRGKVIPGF